MKVELGVALGMMSRTVVIDVPDDCSDEELDQELEAHVQNNIDSWWSKKEDK